MRSKSQAWLALLLNLKYDSAMPTTLETSAPLKDQVKSALVEILREQPELLRETLEDVALGRAIAEGMKTKDVSRDRVFATLRGRKT